MARALVLAAFTGVVLVLAPCAAAGDWLPHPADATWTYSWTDSAYNPTPTREKVTVSAQSGPSFELAWTTEGQDNPDEAPTSVGTVAFQETSKGLNNIGWGTHEAWASTLPPPDFPILCPALGSCGNSLASTYYNLIWGGRVPVLREPLLAGTSWSSSGGASDDVLSTSDYLGLERVSVPAFPAPVLAAKVRSQISQAGALGDPYGSGVRTVWWVFGVGPVKIVFEHIGGTSPPITTAVLESTNQEPKPFAGDANYFPLRKGLKGVYRWTNSRYFKQPVVERFVIDAVVNTSARVTFASVSGPLKVAGGYVYATGLDGVTNLSGQTKAASLAKLPPLGPKALPPDRRRHFFTPFDLMNFGFNPLLPAYPRAGDGWTAASSGRDFSVYGVTGKAKVVGVQTVKVPAGRFRALAVRTTLNQAGFPFGTGTRTSWFAPGRGLVRLVFEHGDGSVSRVELVK